MTWIEGVGDEVTACLTVALILILLIVAWYSTAVSERAFGYYILVIERRPRIFQSNATSSTISEIQNETTIPPETTPEPSSQSCNKTDSESQKTDCEKGNRRETDSEISKASASAIKCTESKSKESTVTACKLSSADTSSSEVHVETLAAELPTLSQGTSETFHESATILDDSDQIHIRLKFLNDTQQEVTARLGDKVGDFKRRHFADDLASNKIVRLIFNGQVLRNDQETLQSYGVNNGCVVHCLIVSSTEPSPIATSEERDGLEVGSLMLPLFGLILSLIWYCRVQHRQYFNTSSTLALTGITCLFFFVVIAMHWPHQQDNRQRITELENSHQRNNGLDDIHPSSDNSWNSLSASRL